MTAFAALEARVNAAALAKLANAAGVLDGVAVEGIFDNAYMVSDGGVGMASAGPAFTLATWSVPDAPYGKQFVHDSITYTVAEHQPDGRGMSVLFLERTT